MKNLYFCTMKHSLFLTFAFAVLVLCSCSSNGPRSERYEQNRQELMRIREKAKQHLPITDEVKIDSLYDFFAANGTEEDLFLASFYKALFFQQMGDKKNAYDMMRSAYDNRPSFLSDITRITLRNLFDWMQTSCIQDKNAEELQKWILKAEEAAIYKTNELYLLQERKACYFDIMEMPDSSHHYMQLSIENMLRHPEWDKNKCMILAEIAGWHAQRGEHKKFLEVYELVKQHPYHAKSDATDFYAGLFYNQTGQRDSAEVCFRRATKSSNDIAGHAFIQLAIMAHNKGQHDSVFSCFQGYVAACDSLLQQQQAESTQKLEAAFKMREQAAIIAQQKIYILSLICLLFGLMLCAVIGWRTTVAIKRRISEKEDELEQEKRMTEKLQEQLAKALKHEGQDVPEGARMHLLEEKIREWKGKLLNSAASFTDDDYVALSKLFVESYPKFVQQMTDSYPRFKSYDIIICALVIYGFGQTEIGNILQKERQQIGNAMRRISQNLTGKSIGRIVEFKAMLEELMYEE